MTQSQPPTNLYPMLIFDLHARIRKHLDELNAAGQIDLDTNGYPFITNVSRDGSTHVVSILRNRVPESFIVNTRKQQPAINSWSDDGFVRPNTNRKQIPIDNDNPNRERAKRESYKNIVAQLVK